MPERQSSPGEAAPRPGVDAAEKENGTGAEQGPRAEGSAQPVASEADVTSAAAAGDTAQASSDAGGNGAAVESTTKPVTNAGAKATAQAGTETATPAGQGSEHTAAGAGGARPSDSPASASPKDGPAAERAAAKSTGTSGTSSDGTGTNGAGANGSGANGSGANGAGANGAGASSAGGNGSATRPAPSARPSGSSRPPTAPRPVPRPHTRPEPSGERAGVRTSAGEPEPDESPTVRTPAEQRAAAARRPAATAPATPTLPARSRGTWFAPVDADATDVMPRMPAAPASRPQPPAPMQPHAQRPAPAPAPVPAAAPKEPEAATEVIPVTQVTAALPSSPSSPSSPPPGGPNAEHGEDGEPRPRRRRFLVVTAVAVGVLGLLYVSDLLLSSGSVPRGVTVAGVAVGGLPPGEAEQRLRAEIEPRTTRPFPVSVGEATSEIDPVASGLSIDWPGTLAQVAGQPFNPITRITSFFTEQPVAMVTSADQTALNSALEELAPVVDRAPVEGSVAFDGTDPQPVDPQPGQRLDVAAAVDVLQRDWVNGGTVALPLIEQPATTTPEDVATAIEEVARPAVADPVTLVGENGVRGTITPEVIASALLFRAEDGALVPEINRQAVQDAVAPQMAPSERPGRDATLDFASGRPVVVPSQDGRGVDYEATLAELLSVLTSTGPREITAVYADQPAEVTTEDLEALGNPEVIGEFSTAGFARDSGMNIRRAAELINGVVVQPGETFSLDAATGPRTAANGYVEAGVIDNGQPSRGIAGGASQVSTTLYNAAYFAGMTLLEHRPHSFYISRYPAGREATIATGAIDNRFRNDNPTPVLIRTQWTPTSVTVLMYGQRQFEVTGSFGPRTNPTQPNTVTIPPGQPCNPSNGAPGFTITDTRTRRDVSSGETRSETFTTRYNPSPRVVCAP